MYRGVDPATTLRKQNGEGVGDYGPAASLWQEHHLPVWKGAKQDCGKKSILAKEEEVLLVQSRYFTLTVFFDDLWLDNQRNPVIATGFARLEPEHGKTAWKTRNTTKDRLESFGKVMRDEVFEHLDGGDPRLSLICDTSLPAHPHNHLIVMHAIDEMAQE